MISSESKDISLAGNELWQRKKKTGSPRRDEDCYNIMSDLTPKQKHGSEVLNTSIQVQTLYLESLPPVGWSW